VRVLVDTSIWSLSLRRRSKDLAPKESILRDELMELVAEGRALLIGPIRQEILSGIRNEVQYGRLRDILRWFSDEPLAASDYELAAKLSNQCRVSGIVGSPSDFLLCAVATGRDCPIFTSDGDFKTFGGVFPIRLHGPRGVSR